MCYRRSCYYKFLYIVSVRLYSHSFVRLSVLVNLVVFVHVIVAVPDGVAAASAIGVACDQPTNRPTNQSTTQKPICTPLTKDFFYLFFPSCSICCPFWCSGLHHCSSVSHHPKKHTHSCHMQLPSIMTMIRRLWHHPPSVYRRRAMCHSRWKHSPCICPVVVM